MTRRTTEEEIIGVRFGNLCVTSLYMKNSRANVTCSCDCGGEWSGVLTSLISGLTRSCGCYRRDRGALSPTYAGVHKMSNTPEYKAWSCAKYRAVNSGNTDYPSYGGRGVGMCDEWLNDFQAFYSHIGPKPSQKHSIDRIDNNKGYEPGNVRWATSEVQNNNKRTNRVVTLDGFSLTVAQWCRELNLSYKTVLKRINSLQWEPARAILTPTNTVYSGTQ